MLKTLIICCFFMISTNVFSQDNTSETESKKAPLSIYTDGISIVTADFNRDLNSQFFAANQFQFRIIDQQKIEHNMFMIDFRNIGRKASAYDYESYRKATLNRYFEVVPDIVVLNRFSNFRSVRKN